MQFIEMIYFTPTALEKAGGFRPLRLGRNVAKTHYHEGPKYVTYFSLHIVLEGRGEFRQNNRTYPLRKGDLFCLFPKIATEYWTDRDDVLQLAWISFQGKQALSILHRIGLRPYSPHLSAIANDKTVKRLERLFQFFRQSVNDARDLRRQSLFFQFFQTLSTRSPLEKSVDPHFTEAWLQKGLEFLDMHYAEGITIEETAKYAEVSRTHFSKQFQKTVGISPSEYLNSLIMKEAGKMVEGTNYSFSEIALSVGFPDLYSFSKAFKKFYGMSPTMYRNLHI
jgi:AraC-like DNA-binding protein